MLTVEKIIIFLMFCVYGTQSQYSLVTIQASIGSQIKLSCNYSGYALSTITFSRHQVGQLSSPIYTSSVFVPTFMATHSISTSVTDIIELTILSVTSSEYSYFYRCITATGIVDLSLWQLASSTSSACEVGGSKASPIYEVTRGSSQTLQCSIGSLPISGINWSRHQPPLVADLIYSSSTLLIPSKYSVSNNSTFTSLTILNATEVGFFTCIYYDPTVSLIPTDLGMYSVCPKAASTTVATTTRSGVCKMMMMPSHVLNVALAALFTLLLSYN